MKKILSCGGGLDSFAMLLLAIRTGELPDHVVFADVGSGTQESMMTMLDGEWPSTYRHLGEVVIPLCVEYGIPFTWIDHTMYPIRGRESLLAYFESKNIMPTRMSRLCTSAAKVERITEWLDYYYPHEQLEVWIGFEAGEETRAAKDPHSKASSGAGRRVNRFPLIEEGLCRCRCEDLARASGMPVPRKSACMFCPFSSRGDFQTLAAELPEVFERVQLLEDRCRRTKSGAVIKFSGTEVPLREWIAKPYTPRVISCEVCGRTPRASKATGCTYLSE